MKTDKVRIYRKRIKNVLRYIEDNIQQDMSLTELAQISHFSDYHFHRIFKSLVGETLKEYIRRVRLEKACYMFTYSDHTIADIAHQCGFNSHENFIRAFKRQFGHNPNEGRSTLRTAIDDFLQQSLSALDNPADDMQYQKINDTVIIKSIDNISVSYMRVIGAYDNANALWLTLMAEVGSEVFFDPDTTLYAITHDIPGITAEDKCRLDACLHTDKHPLNLQQRIIKGGLFAAYTFTVADDSIEAALDMLVKDWLPYSGYTPRDEPIHYAVRNLQDSALSLGAPTVEIFIPIAPITEDN